MYVTKTCNKPMPEPFLQYLLNHVLTIHSIVVWIVLCRGFMYIMLKVAEVSNISQ